VKAKVVMQFILSQFESPELKKQYLTREGREKVLAALESTLKW
jgi:hypothetical protein